MQIDPHELAAKIAEASDGEVHTHKSLAAYTTYRIGGPTAIWVAPASVSGVGRALKIIHHHRLPFFILGRGSNLLI